MATKKDRPELAADTLPELCCLLARHHTRERDRHRSTIYRRPGHIYRNGCFANSCLYHSAAQDKQAQAVGQEPAPFVTGYRSVCPTRALGALPDPGMWGIRDR